MADNSASSRLRQIASQIRRLPATRGVEDLAIQAGQLFREALDLGAFPGSEYADLHNAVRYPVVRATSDLASSAFVNQWRVEDKTGCVQAWDEAVKQLVPRRWREPKRRARGRKIEYDPMLIDIGRGECWRNACAPIAKLIDAEAERLLTPRQPKRRRRKRKPDPKREAKRKERQAQEKIDKAIETEWSKGEWDTYADYSTWKNEYLPDGWPQLNQFYVQRAIGRVRRNQRYAKK